MHLNLAIFKKHPYAAAGVGLFLFVVFYLMLRGSSSGGATTSVVSSGPSAGDIQLAQIAAAQNAASVQANAQVAQTQLQAGVQNNQTAATLEAVKVQTAAQLATAQAQISASTAQQAAALTAQTQMNADNNSTQVQLLSVNDAANVAQQQILGNIITTQLTSQADILKTQYNDQLAAHMNDNATNLAGFQTQADYLTNVANLQAGLDSQQLAQYGTAQQYILQHAGDKKNSALDATDQTALFQTILSHGNPTVATSGNFATTQADVSGNNQLANLLNSASNLIAKSGAMVVGGL